MPTVACKFIDRNKVRFCTRFGEKSNSTETRIF